MDYQDYGRQSGQSENPVNPASDHSPARVRLDAFRERLASVKVLDPACGSGNFLYIVLRSLLDFEKEVIDYAAAQGWLGLTPMLQPDQMLGLEINHYAAELARTALWIGYIQWHQGNGFGYTQRPILTPLDTIRQADAILDLSDPEHPAEPEWPAAKFIVGNPPFWGGKLLRTGLSDEYVDALFRQYDGRVPAEADLVATGSTRRSGQSKRGRSNGLACWRRRGYGAAPTGGCYSASRRPATFSWHGRIIHGYWKARRCTSQSLGSMMVPRATGSWTGNLCPQ